MKNKTPRNKNGDLHGKCIISSSGSIWICNWVNGQRIGYEENHILYGNRKYIKYYIR